MQTLGLKTPRKVPSPDKIIWIMPQPGVATRLARALADTMGEFGKAPLLYLRVAFLPDRLQDWLPFRVMTLAGASLSHPVDIVRGGVAPDAIDPKRRPLFLPILSLSAAVHGSLIVYLIYLAFFSAFAHVRL